MYTLFRFFFLFCSSGDSHFSLVGGGNEPEAPWRRRRRSLEEEEEKEEALMNLINSVLENNNCDKKLLKVWTGKTMPVSCSAWDCKNRCTIQTRSQGITFHRYDLITVFLLYLAVIGLFVYIKNKQTSVDSSSWSASREGGQISWALYSLVITGASCRSVPD